MLWLLWNPRVSLQIDSHQEREGRAVQWKTVESPHPVESVSHIHIKPAAAQHTGGVTQGGQTSTRI